MKKIILLVLAIGGLNANLPVYAKEKPQALDNIMAVINDDVITTSEFNRAMNITKTQMQQQNMALPTDDVLRKQVLTQLINKRLQIQVATQANIKISDANLNKAVERIAEQNHLSVNELYEQLAKTGMAQKDYRNELREQMMLQTLQQQEVVNHIVIKPEEVTAFMHSKVWQSNGAKEYRLEDILVALPDAATPAQIAEAKNIALDAVNKLRAGKSVADVTSEQKNNAIQSGDLGWRKLPEIPTAFVNTVANMKDKDIAEPIQTGNGFHILHLVESHVLNDESAKPTRKQAEEALWQRKISEGIAVWISKLRGQAFIKTKDL